VRSSSSGPRSNTWTATGLPTEVPDCHRTADFSPMVVTSRDSSESPSDGGLDGRSDGTRALLPHSLGRLVRACLERPVVLGCLHHSGGGV
jgi:hypothetical protein